MRDILLVTTWDAAILAAGCMIAKALKLTPDYEIRLLVFALVGRFGYMLAVNSASFLLAKLISNGKLQPSYTIYLRAGFALLLIIGILLLNIDTSTKKFISASVSQPLLLAAVFVPTIAAYTIRHLVATSTRNT